MLTIQPQQLLHSLFKVFIKSNAATVCLYILFFLIYFLEILNSL